MKTTYRKSWPGNLFQLLTLTFDPFFSANFGHLTTKALYLTLSSDITDPEAVNKCCSSGLVLHYNIHIIVYIKCLMEYTVRYCNIYG